MERKPSSGSIRISPKTTYAIFAFARFSGSDVVENDKSNTPGSADVICLGVAKYLFGNNAELRYRHTPPKIDVPRTIRGSACHNIERNAPSNVSQFIGKGGDTVAQLKMDAAT